MKVLVLDTEEKKVLVFPSYSEAGFWLSYTTERIRQVANGASGHYCGYRRWLVFNYDENLYNAFINKMEVKVCG